MLEEEEEQKAGEGWIVSFADLMTLLFAFFVVLWGLKSEGETLAILGVTSSIREAFVEIPEEIPKDQRKGPIMKGQHVFKYFKGDAIGPPIIKKYRRASNAVNVINTDFAQVKQIIAQINQNNSGAKAGAGKQGDIATVHRDEEGIIIRLASSYFYESGQYRVKRQSLDNLQQVGRLIRDMGRPVVVEGHTDAVPPSNGYTNLDLSSLRASHVGNYLVKELGIESHMVTVSGYGSSKPIARNNTADGRAMNRRVELKVKYD